MGIQHLILSLAPYEKKWRKTSPTKAGQGTSKMLPYSYRYLPDILYDSWSPAMTVSSICISILSMLSSSTVKQRPTDNDRYVKNCRKSPKETRWWFHDDKV
ncbi:unnamed protein product [Camellia sinensis]